MDFIILDKETYYPLGIVEVYLAGVWIERFREAGEFELKMPVGIPVLEHMVVGNYLTLLDSDRAMIIEYMDVSSESKTGEKTVYFKGESLESILKRRIVWHQTVLNGPLLTELERILDENLGAASVDTSVVPPNTSRQIPNFRFRMPDQDSPTYEYLSQINITAQFTGDSLYDVVVTLAEEIGFGWKLTISEGQYFDFEVFIGSDRTFDNDDPAITPIIFSPEYGNLLSSKFVYSNQAYKNLTLVLGEDEGDSRARVVVWTEASEPSGLDRRELYTDARDLQSEREGGDPMTPEEYQKSLITRGKKKLAENSITTAFDGKMETHVGPQYGKDFFLGDYVSTMNEYGMGAHAMVFEFLRTNDENGYDAYPSFVMIS